MSDAMSGDRHGAAARHSSAAAESVPSDVGSGRGRRAAPAPITFVQHVDGRYVEWSVVEVDVGGVPGARAARCLLFSRDDCIRRVWDYPADWRDLDDAALSALSWQR